MLLFCHQIARYCSYVTVSVIANIIMETTMLITYTVTVATSPTINMAQTWDIVNDIYCGK